MRAATEIHNGPISEPTILLGAYLLPIDPTIQMTESQPKKMKTESHSHGDPLLQAALKHDKDVDAQLRKFVKQEHDRLVSSQRHAVGEKGWFFHDIFPSPVN
jgi:hypothetical protein